MATRSTGALHLGPKEGTEAVGSFRGLSPVKVFITSPREAGPGGPAYSNSAVSTSNSISVALATWMASRSAEAHLAAFFASAAAASTEMVCDATIVPSARSSRS